MKHLKLSIIFFIFSIGGMSANTYAADDISEISVSVQDKCAVIEYSKTFPQVPIATIQACINKDSKGPMDIDGMTKCLGKLPNNTRELRLSITKKCSAEAVLIGCSAKKVKMTADDYAACHYDANPTDCFNKRGISTDLLVRAFKICAHETEDARKSLLR